MNEVSRGVSVRVLTYDDIASELGLKPASARQLVRRNGWRRLPGNDGRTRIEIPVEEFERALRSKSETPLDIEETDDETPVIPSVDSPLERALVTALTGHVERLERALDDAQTALSAVTGERDAERAAAFAARGDVLVARGQLEVLRVQLGAAQERTAAAERRAEDAAAERDRWHRIATHVPEPRRSWWRRLAG